MSDDPTEIRADVLLQLSEELTQVAASLARLSMDTSGAKFAVGPDAERKDVPLELVSSAIRARRVRDRCFPKEIFADPAWGVMLELLRAEILQRRVQVSSLSLAAGVRPAIALRWVDALVHHGLVIRRADPIHPARAYVDLSPQANASFRRYFADLRTDANASR